MKLFTPASWKNIIATLCIVTIEKFELTLLPQQTHQRWNKVDRQRSSTLFQHWYLVENESWADVHLSRLFQCWQNNVELTLIDLRRFNVDEPMLFQHWKLVENESWAVDRITSIQRQWLIVISTLVVSWKWNLSQGMFISVASTMRKQHLNNFINCCNNVH